MQQVRLLGLGGKTGAGASPLDIQNDHRQFKDHSQPHGFAFQGNPRTTRSRYRHGTSKRRADHGSHGSDFIFGLKGAHAEMLVLAQLMKDVAGRCDRIRTVKQLFFAQMRRGHQTPRQGLVAGYVAVFSGRQIGFIYAIAANKRFRGFPIVPSRLQCVPIGFSDRRLITKLAIYEALCGLEAAVVQPINQPHGKEVAAAVSFFLAQPHIRSRLARESSQGDSEQLITVQGAIVQGILFIPGLLDCFFVERVFIDDQNSAAIRIQIAQICRQRRGVHGDECVQPVSWCKDLR